MDPNYRGLLVFAGATVGAAALQQVATRQAAKLGLPHAAVGVIAGRVPVAG